MSKYIMIEANRINGKRNYGGISEDEDTYKNKWTNNVNSSGIQIDPGDVITCEGSAINTIGATDQTVEFTGEENTNGFVDHKVSMNMAYYVNDTGFNLINCPLTATQTSIGYTHETTGADIDQMLLAPIETLRIRLSARCIGETYLEEGGNDHPTYTEGPPRKGFTPSLLRALPKRGLVYSISLDPLQTGLNYIIDKVYDATKVNPAVPGTPTTPGKYFGSDMTIKVLDVRSETNFPDMPSKIQLQDPGGRVNPDGTNVRQGPFDFNDCPFEVIIGSGKGDEKQIVKVESYINTNFRTKVPTDADGRRYYFGPQDWTGCCLSQYTGQPSDGNGKDLGNLQPTFDYRQTKVDIQVPTGLSTPTNIAGLITDQLHAPTRMTIANNLSPAFDNNTIDFSAYKQRTVKQNEATDYVRPPLISTPTYKPFPAGNSAAQPNQEMDTFSGTRRQYYSQFGMDNPDKFAGLQYTRQLRYGLTNNDVNNQVNSGGGQRSLCGDFGNQTIGYLGVNQAIMHSAGGVSQDPSDPKLQFHDKGAYIVTNTYFTEETVRTIANGFRRAERYYDDLSIPLDPDSDTYKKGLAVAMDIGLYCEEMCNAYPLTPSDKDNAVVGPIPNQRRRFLGGYEAHYISGGDTTSNFSGLAFVDEGAQDSTTDANAVFTEKCRGTIPFGNEQHRDTIARNDGQELSSFVFTSRYDGDKPFSETQSTSAYEKLYSRLSSQGTDQFNVSGQSIADTFTRTYTDTDPAIGTQTIEQLMALTEKYDVALIPVFPRPEDDPTYYKFGGRPYVAYKSHYAVGSPGTGPDFNPANPSRDQKWQIDSKNTFFGMQLGLDPSAGVRNNISLLYNTNYATMKDGDSDSATYSSVLYMGAVNPSLDFDTTLSRFQWTGFNTPFTLGNGTPGINQDNIEASDSPQEQVYGVAVRGAISDTVTGQFGTPVTYDGVNYGKNVQKTIMMYAESESERFLDSLSGLSFLDITLYDSAGNKTTFDYKGTKTVLGQTQKVDWKATDIQNTLLGKMGFELRQMLPVVGSSQATFTDEISFKTDFSTPRSRITQTPCPMTTGAYISSAEFQPVGSNSKNYPLYNLYPSIGLPAQPTVSQASITAFNLPQKLDYPYLLVYSSLMADGTDTTYYGGCDGKSKLPCIGYISRQYSGGDYFYGLEQAFSYTANKSFTITDINTEIRLPDGSRPRLQPNSGVIYKITKPIYQPPPSPQAKK